MFQSQRGHQVQDGVVVPGHGIGVHPNAKPRDWLGPGDERRHGIDTLDEDERGLAGNHKRIQGRVQDFAADVVEHGMRRMDVHPIGVQVDQHLCSFGALLGMQQVLQIGGLLDGGRTRGMEATQPRLGQSFDHAGGVQGANIGRRRQNGALVQVLQQANERGDVVRGVHGRGGRGQDWDLISLLVSGFQISRLRMGRFPVQKNGPLLVESTPWVYLSVRSLHGMQRPTNASTTVVRSVVVSVRSGIDGRNIRDSSTHRCHTLHTARTRSRSPRVKKHQTPWEGAAIRCRNLVSE